MLRPKRLQMVTEGPTLEEEARIDEHFNYLANLAHQGTVILFGRTTNDDESTFGLVIFEAKSSESATTLMENDPAVKSGIMHAKLFPYSVAFLRGR